MVKDKRPINLDLGSLQYPPMAIVSILHRISGLVMFLLLPVMLCYFGTSLHSQESFDALKVHLMSIGYKALLFGFCVAWVYHVIAGVRHMLMDIGFGESLVAGRRSAILVLSLAVLSAFFLGVWIW